MEKVFISYSHGDARFCDRLVMDLRASDVPATYDKWLLRVGDSIIQKIAAEVSEADKVNALLSPASVESNWVKRELALAMTGEVNTGGVKVLPALIGDCELPHMLADKLYADFRHSYYYGLRALLEALLPSFYEREKFIRHEQIESAHRELEKIVAEGDRDKIYNWFSSNGYALAALFGRLWAVSEAVPQFPVGKEIADFLVINGQSGRYELSLIVLGNTSWSIEDEGIARREAQRLEGMLKWCRKHEKAVRHALAIKMASTYGADQIAPVDRGRWTPSVYRHHLEIDAKLLLGRRSDFGEEENNLRHGIYNETKHGVDIISYDRVLNAVEKILSGRRSYLNGRAAAQLTAEADRPRLRRIASALMKVSASKSER
jgi:hypothetical protein